MSYQTFSGNLRIERVNFSNDTGWTVARATFVDAPPINTPPVERSFGLVGELGRVKEGDIIYTSGEWTEHAKFGLQLKAKTAAPVLGGSESDLAAFLARMPQMGQARAWQVIRKLGGREATLFALENAPELLCQVPGITEERALAIGDTFLAKQGVADSLAFLSGLNIGERTVAKAIDHWEGKAREYVTDDPYVLTELPGIGFKRADEIARSKLKLAQDDPRRCRAAAELAIKCAEDEGHAWSSQAELCGVGRTRLAMRIRAETALAPPQLERGFDLALCESTLTKRKRPPSIIRRLQRGEDGGHLQGETVRIWKTQTDSAEQDIAENLTRLLHGSDESTTLLLPPDVWGELKPAPEQAEAVNAIAENRVMVITGGPGVGKTATTSAVLRVLNHNQVLVGCCAPTGKAAKRMAEQTGQEAVTIHRLLKYVPGTGFRHDGSTPEHDAGGKWITGGPVDFGAIIVDEASMVDVQLFAALLKAIPTGARLIIVGDVDQLPSIGAGQVLHDIIESGIVPVCRLSRIFRQAEESRIPYVARDINSGRPPDLGAGGDVRFIPEDDAENIAQCIIKAATTVLATSKDGRRAFDPMTEVQVLAAQKSGPAGVEALNRALQQALNPGADGIWIGGGYRTRIGDRVIHVKNNYDLEVYNGEMGAVIAADFKGIPASELYSLGVPLGEGDGTKDRVLVVDFGDRKVAYRKMDVMELLLGYAITVHKSQGSQFPAVLLPVHESHAFMLTRSLLYTGLTRAAEFMVVFGQAKQVVAAARNTRGTGRRTTLQERLLFEAGQ